MTPERLAQLEAHFKNPPSATCNAEWALELVEAVRALTLQRDIAVAIKVGAPKGESFAVPIVLGAEPLPPPEPESKPTPPASPKAEKKAKK